MLSRFLRFSVNLIPWGVRNKIRRIPVVAGLQRWVVNKFLAGRTFNHTINAGPAKGLVYPVTLPQDKGIWTGTYELPFASALAASVRPGDVCYDVGGFRGFMSGVCGRAGASQVIVFEPFPANGEQIRKMAGLNPGLAIRLEPVAVGDRDGEVEFRVMPEDSMGKLADSPFQPDARASGALTVPIRKLDSLVAEGSIPPPNVVKIDVEGAELFVLRGAEATLRRHHPRLLIEAHSPNLARDCTAFLEGLGYQVTTLEPPARRSHEGGAAVSHLKAEADGVPPAR